MRSPVKILPRLLAALLLVSQVQAATEYVEGEVIVTFKPTANAVTAEAALTKRALRFAERFGALSAKRKRETGLVREKAKTTVQLIADLKADPTVELVEPNYVRWISADPNDSRFAEMWALKNTGQTVNGTAGTASADVSFVNARNLARAPRGEIVVGVIDSGVDYIHPDLAANVWTNPAETANGTDDDGNGYKDDLHGYDFASGDADPLDSGYHGTHVAGTIAALGDNQTGVIGVAEHIRILPLKVSTDGSTISSSAAISALQYATALKNRGVNIVALNASYGGGGYSATESAAIQAAGDAGIILCVAAGNSAANNDATATYPASYRLPNMITVAATTQTDALASFSNYGATTVDLGAPGSNILSTKPSTVTLQVGGTTYNYTAFAFAGVTAGLTGTVVDCGTGNAANQFPAAVRGNIALIQRGTANFTVKVRNAMDAGAKAAIIYNNTAGPITGGTLLSASDWIPTYAISQADGQAIKAALPKTGAVVVTGAYQYLDGTSMATPHVTGAVAFAAMNFPGDTVAQRRQRILASVDVKPGLQGKVATGGRLNLQRLVDSDNNGFGDWQPQITTTTLPLAINGENFTTSLIAAGGTGSYTWSIASGALPSGFSLTNGGVISGTSKATGSASFTVQVTDSSGAANTQALVLNTAAHGPLDHFTWEFVPATVYTGSPFAVRLSGRDAGGRLVTTLTNNVSLVPGSSGAVPSLTPASVRLTDGYFVGYLTLSGPSANVAITAAQGLVSSTSGSLTVGSAASSAGDGLPDSWKSGYGLSATASPALLDSDGDGMTNQQEFAAGTDPTSALSRLQITSLSSDASTYFTLSFPAVAGKLYGVSTSDDLTSWTPLSPPILATTSGSQTVTLALSGELKAFFRVEIAP